MSMYCVDVESDGPAPGSDMYSMVSFGIVKVTPALDITFYGQCAPISPLYIPEALAISGHSRDECQAFPPPYNTMQTCATWIADTNEPGERPIFVSDNAGFDFAFMNHYFHKFVGANPFGYSSTDMNDVYKGCVQNVRKNFHHLRQTKHTHHPVDDARGNAEALLAMNEKFNLGMRLVQGCEVSEPPRTLGFTGCTCGLGNDEHDRTGKSCRGA